MSWSSTTAKAVLKQNVDEAIDAMVPNPTSGDAMDQIRTAKVAAKLLAHNVPGPYINVFMNGHANGVGSHKKEGFANDTINVSVTQITEEDLRFYQ